MSVDQTKFMRRAIELSRRAVDIGDGETFGAVVVKDNKIIGEGWNQTLSTYDPSAHAEVQAIKKACATLETLDLSDCEIYTSCEPCAMCAALIKMTNIKQMYYGTTLQAIRPHFSIDYVDSYRDMDKPVYQRSIYAKQVLGEMAFQVIQDKYPL